MFINKIDELFYKILDNLYIFITKKTVFNKITKDPNFVTYQEYILKVIKEFSDLCDPEIKKLKLNNKLNNYISNIIKRYCAFYIYLGIAYYYKNGRDLYITNIIESSKNQKDTIIQINNFFNSLNNSKIINFFSDIQNIIGLTDFKTIEKIKIILQNNPIKYQSIIELFNELGEEYIMNNFFIKNNFHNIIKTIIYKQIYINEEKNEINELILDIDKEEGEYKFIEVIISNEKKLVDFHILQRLFTFDELKKGYAEDIYQFLQENLQENEQNIIEDKNYINLLFSNKILTPITEEFLRYHKDTEKYGDENKVKYLLNKINTVSNYYSEKNKNRDFFYKNLDPRMAILFNEIEEEKLIYKLSISESDKDIDDLNDIINIRKYNYINFKKTNKPYLKIRSSQPIDTVRYINLKKKKYESIETRISNENNDVNIIGVLWNPTIFNKVKRPLECFKIKDMIDVRNFSKKKNAYNGFVKILDKSEQDKSNQLFYWIFDFSKDIPKLDTYHDFSINDGTKNIKVILEEVYKIYINIVKLKFENVINKNFQLDKMDLLFKIFANKYFDFNIKKEIKNELIYNSITNNLKEVKIVEKTYEINTSKIIKLPTLDIKIKKETIVNIDKNVKELKEIDITFSKCIHYIKWAQLAKTSKNSQDFSQHIFDFVKKYLKENSTGEYICKSCNELLDIKKYVSEGTYYKETGSFSVTSLVNRQKLEDNDKYKGLLLTIQKIEEKLERIVIFSNIIYYIGNDSVIRNHRKSIIKDTIDLLLIHTEYLKKQPKDRIETASRIYNINSELTNLFFFELKNDIFLVSSIDTDKYKILKYNNVIAYLTFILTFELNSGQILALKNDKRCNYYLFSKIKDQLFGNLYIRINNKDKIPLIKVPLLAYCLFYFSCILTTKNIWLYYNESKEFNINVQKSIIHTVVDLINTIVEANLQKEKNFLHEIIYERYLFKLKNVFSDKEILDRIASDMESKIVLNEATQKKSFYFKKVEYIHLEKHVEEIEPINFEYCTNKYVDLKKIKYEKENFNINILTICKNGKFHKWNFDKNDMICSVCKESYHVLLKKNKDIESNEYLKKINIINLENLTKKYCINGDLHNLDKNDICELCKINPTTFKFKEKELLLLEKNLENIKDKEYYVTDNINILQNEIDTNNLLCDNFHKEYEKKILKSDSLEHYIKSFINRCVDILGNKIKIKNDFYYLKDDIYTIDHDYQGILLNKEFTFLESQNVLKIFENHFYFKKDVYYIKDKSKEMFIYYDIPSLQYIGYSEDNKVIKTAKTIASIKVKYSLLHNILVLGLENQYINLFHYDREFKTIDLDMINNILRTRVINIKQIILYTQSILNSISNQNYNFSFYKTNQKNITMEFNKKLKYFNMKNIFSDYGAIRFINLNKIHGSIKTRLITNYLDSSLFNKMNNTDSKLIYYLIKNFNQILDQNNEIAIQSELCYLIIVIIMTSVDNYFNNYNSLGLRKFDYDLLTDTSYKHQIPHREQEYFDIDQLTDEQKQELKETTYDLKEEQTSLDIDEYDVNDDEDETMEALDSDLMD
jgi:hypothetical protein